MAHAASAKHFVARHPRYIAILGCILLGLVFIYAQGPPDEHYLKRNPLKAWILEEDRRYQQTLRERDGMVRKWGPTPERVQAFPPQDDFYTLWDFYIPSFRCPHRVERVGALGDGGKWVCGLERIAQQDSCVIYSFGINNESSFEAALMRAAPRCQVWGYDFSVPNFGPEITEDASLRARAHFRSWGLGSADNYGPDANPPFYTLQTLMAMNGHSFIDILKVDIEGAEFDALASFLAHHVAQAANRPPPPPPPSNPHGPPPPPPSMLPLLPIGQLQIELHARSGSGHDTFAAFNSWWESLEAVGLRPFFAEPNLVYVNLVRGVRPDLVEYSLLNIRGDHTLVSDRYISY